MSNTNNRPSRSPSVPIPISSRRGNIEELLNLGSLGSPANPALAPTGTSSSQTARVSPARHSVVDSPRQLQGRSAASASSIATSAATNIGASPSVNRHALGGGSGPVWAPRSVSAAVPPPAPRSVGGSLPRSVSGFEPRVIRGNIERTPTVVSATTTDPMHAQRRNSAADTSTPNRPRRSSASTAALFFVSRSPSSVSALRPTPPASVAGSPANPHTTGIGAAASATAAASSASTPTSFPKPSYLQYSALRDLIQTDSTSTLPPSRYSIAMDTSPAGPVLQATQAHRIGRAFTPTSDSDEDSETSVSRGPRRELERSRGRERDRTSAGYVPSSPFVSAQPILRLPTRWSEQDRHASITVSVDGRELHFHGPTNTGDKEAAAARTNHPIPPACGIFYYEVEILNKGQKGYISIGFSIAGVRLNRLPGWEKNSWGYHGDDGHSFVASEKDGSPFGPRFSTGDVIGCGIDFSTYKAFYTKNGAYLGTVFDGVGEHDPIYPSIGLRSAGEAVRVNFGQEPFKYDIDYHVHQTREREWANIQEIPVTWLIDPTNNIFTIEADKSPMAEKASAPTPVMDDHAVKDETGSAPPKDKIREEVFVPIKLPQDFQTPINKLVLSYLTHHGYEKTARAFQTQLDAKRGVRSAPKHLSSSSSRDPRVNGSVDTDIKMETEDMTSSVSQLDFDGLEPEGPNHDELQSRQRIVNAVLTGDIDRALEETRERHPAVLEREDGIMLFKLRCRKFVELVLESSEALKRVKADAEASEVEIEVDGKGGYDGRDSGNAMEVDDDNAHLPPTTNGYANGTGSAAIPIHRPSSRKREVSRPPLVPSVSKCQTTLSDAVAYGKQLQADYKGDTRPEVQSLFKRTFGLVAYDDPLEAGGDVAELASQEARSRLAQEVNQAILESQGRPSRPALERMYRQTSATLTQLGLMGVGAAAFADMTNEFLDL